MSSSVPPATRRLTGPIVAWVVKRTGAAEDIYGDDYTEQQYELTGRLPVHAEAQAFATALEERMGSVVRCVPGFSLDVAQPTTIGLGDSFVGGFLAALVRRRTAPWT